MGDRGTAVRELGANRVVARVEAKAAGDHRMVARELGVRVEARLEVKAAGDHKMDTKNTTVRAQA